ncbi:MAG: UvrD-helicase domain-containing protein, partial [Bacteroidales bacterium]|nr:UvrD-helicase domain-containing protein [Candidatus Sodaliphilus fimicaballi]
MDPLLIVEQCYNRLPSSMKIKPWEATEHGRKVLQSDDELNAYIAAYGEMHIVKCRAALQNFPFDELKLFQFEIFDWGCGQGLATLTLLDMLHERNLLSQVKRIYLIEPSLHALNRAKVWVNQNAQPGIDIISVNKYIPSDIDATLPEVSCSTKISINLFSNILDIKSLNLAWLANKVSSLAAINYNICIGPKFTQNTNTRLRDFCGYFEPEDYFSNINAYPYAYTSRTHHAFGCETKCFVHKRDSLLNKNYIECANEKFYDPYDYSLEILNGVVDEDILKLYSSLRRDCGSTYDVYFRPIINCDTVDFLLLSKSKGIVLINTCKSISSLYDEFNKIKQVKENLFNIHLRSIKIDSIMHSSVYNCVKIALYFPNSTESEISAKIGEINQKLNKNQEDKSKDNYFKFLHTITRDTDLHDKFEKLYSSGFKFDYYEELANIISSKWHSYKEGDLSFRLTNTQKQIVRRNTKRIRVKGVAGCGKTQVVANRAVERHLATGERVLIITFNISLVQYIRMRIKQVPADFAPSMFEITNYHQFFKSMANEYSKNRILLGDFD